MSVDALQSNLPVAQVLAQRGLLLAPDFRALGLPPDRIVGENWGDGCFTAVNPIIYNTIMRKPEELPKSWQAREFDPAKRVELLRNAQSEIMKKSPAVFLLQYQNAFGVNNRVDFNPRTDDNINAWDITPKR